MGTDGYRYFDEESDDIWEFRLLEDGQKKYMGSKAEFMHRQSKKGVCLGDCSTVEEPGGFWPWNWGRPGRFWIETHEPGDCVAFVTSLIHEMAERSRALREGRPHQEFHEEVDIPASEAAKRACNACCPVQ